nr:hypothetical protein CFP56_56150 [Quercus suber]
MVDDRESGNQASEDENEEQSDRDPGVVGRNPRIVAEEGAPGMETVPRKRTVAIFGGMSIAILVVVWIVLRNQRGRVSVALHRRRSGSRPDRARVPELDHGSPRTEIQLSLSLSLSVKDVELIKKIPLSRSIVEDTLYWPYSTSGHYLCKSRCRFIKEESEMQAYPQAPLICDKKVWKEIWQMQILPKTQSVKGVNWLWKKQSMHSGHVRSWMWCGLIRKNGVSGMKLGYRNVGASVERLVSSKMNSVARQAWRLLRGPSQSGSIDLVSWGGNHYQTQQWRGIRVKVRDGNLEQALTWMQRKMQSSGIERLIKKEQRHHIKNSEKRILARKNLERKIRSQDLARKLKAILVKKVRGL